MTEDQELRDLLHGALDDQHPAPGFTRRAFQPPSPHRLRTRYLAIGVAAAIPVVALTALSVAIMGSHAPPPTSLASSPPVQVSPTVDVSPSASPSTAPSPIPSATFPIVGPPPPPPATPPPGRADALLAPFPEQNSVVMSGGRSGSTVFNDTWTWNGNSWTQRHPATSPPIFVAMARDGNS